MLEFLLRLIFGGVRFAGFKLYISINSSVFYLLQLIKPEAVITVVRAPDDGCQHPKHVELPTEM